MLGGFLFVITLYLQEVRGDSPLRAGLSLLPATLVMAAAAPVAGQLTARRGPRVPLVASGLCIAAGSRCCSASARPRPTGGSPSRSP